MKLTKYEHSCLDIEEAAQRLLIDPGIVTTSVPNYDNIVAVLVTHVHPDHFDADKLAAIHQQNPDAPIYTVQAVADELKGSLPVVVVNGGQKMEVGPFQLEFAGGEHALIHNSVPTIGNVGVTVNGKLYYPGDSLTVPHIPTATLAVPITAPWLKVAEAMDFIIALKPKRVFAVHDALLSGFGMSVNDSWLSKAAESVGAEYVKLKPGDSLDL